MTLIYPDHPTRLGEVYVMDWAGKQSRLIYQTEYIVKGAQFSPNGDEFALIRWHDKDSGNRQIYVVHVDMEGNELHRYDFNEDDELNLWKFEWLAQDVINLNNLSKDKIYHIDTITHKTIITAQELNAYLLIADFPDGEWKIISQWGKSFIQRQRINSPSTLETIVDLPNKYILNYRWSEDSQWFGVIATEGNLGNYYSVPSDIYVVKYDGTHLQKLVEDDNFKSFLPLDSEEHNYLENGGRSFSPNNQWLLFFSDKLNPFRFYLHVARLDNHKLILSNLYTSDTDTINALIQWEPYNPKQPLYQRKIHSLGLLSSGVTLLMGIFGLSIGQWRGQRA